LQKSLAIYVGELNGILIYFFIFWHVHTRGGWEIRISDLRFMRRDLQPIKLSLKTRGSLFLYQQPSSWAFNSEIILNNINSIGKSEIETRFWTMNACLVADRYCNSLKKIKKLKKKKKKKRRRRRRRRRSYYLVKSSLTRLSRQRRSMLRKSKSPPWLVLPVRILCINWKGRVEATSMGNHNFLTYLITWNCKSWKVIMVTYW
jgi:hypothetical protein